MGPALLSRTCVSGLPPLFAAAPEQRVAHGHHEQGKEGRGDQTTYHWDGEAARDEGGPAATEPEGERREGEDRRQSGHQEDRKSTRLNSSHANISYAVFCLKKNKKQ